MKYRVKHETTYRYSSPVTISHNQVRLVPRNTHGQQCLINRQTIAPTPQTIRAWTDCFGNAAGFFLIDHSHRELSVIAESTVVVDPTPHISPVHTPPWEVVRDTIRRCNDPESLAAAMFVHPSPCVQISREMSDYAQVSFTPGRPLLDAALNLTHRIFVDFTYDPTATTVSTPTGDVLHLRRGVCQDFAHLQIACLRALGLAARYVSGYLLTTPAPGESKLIGADASHAWLAVWCPVYGWVALDPTNDCLPSEQHVTVAWGRDYGDVAPIKGVVLGGGTHLVGVSVDVVPDHA